jgi:hypothetical protein
MITVVGMWEPGYTLEQTYIEDTIWKQTLSAFGVDRFCMVTYPEVELPNVSHPEQFSSIEETLASTEGERVFLTFPAEGAVSMRDFNHPADAVYIFGRPGDDLLSYIQPGDHQVHIDTPNNVDMLGCSCVAAVLYDRL